MTRKVVQHVPGQKKKKKNGTSCPVLVQKVPQLDEEPSEPAVQVAVNWRSEIQSEVLALSNRIYSRKQPIAKISLW